MSKKPTPCTPPRATAEPVLALGQFVAVTGAATAGVRLFTRRPPVHSVLIGRCRLEIHRDGRARGLQPSAARVLALPANTAHTLHALEEPYACVAYLDARRYTFADAERLAHTWRGFEPGRDDLREALGDALALPRHKIDERLLRVLTVLETGELSVGQALARAGAGLSQSRLTHLVTDTLGAPPRTWNAWFKLRRALREAMFAGANLTQAAQRAGFADSAHLTRTCKQLMGVLPGQMMPRTIHLSHDD